MRVAINVSGHQLRTDGWVEHLCGSLRRHGVPPERFTCEITESVAMEDTAVTRAAFERLREAGVHVSIDDFGTGQSSLATLHQLPATALALWADGGGGPSELGFRASLFQEATQQAGPPT